MSYLQQILDATKAHNAGVKRNQANLQTVMGLLAIKRQAEAAAQAQQAASVGSSTPLPAVSTGTPLADPHSHEGGFDPNFSNSLNRLLKDFGGKVSIKSGYRSPERQAQLWQQALKKYGSVAAARKWVAPPGHSNHNKGLAADLGFADAGTIAAVHAAAGKYGLVFPLANENWHIEPVGARKK